MKIYLISILLFAIISCDKQSEKTIIEPKFLYPDSSDHCGINLLKGTYVREDNTNDTLIIGIESSSRKIDTWMRNICYSFCIGSPGGDLYTFCVDNDSINLKYLGTCTINIPLKKVKYYFTGTKLYFDKINAQGHDTTMPYLTFTERNFIKIK